MFFYGKNRSWSNKTIIELTTKKKKKKNQWLKQNLNLDPPSIKQKSRIDKRMNKMRKTTKPNSGCQKLKEWEKEDEKAKSKEEGGE